jgi:hypothetical protein
LWVSCGVVDGHHDRMNGINSCLGGRPSTFLKVDCKYPLLNVRVMMLMLGNLVYMIWCSQPGGMDCVGT